MIGMPQSKEEYLQELECLIETDKGCDHAESDTPSPASIWDDYMEYHW